MLRGEDGSLELFRGRGEHLGHSQERSLPERERETHSRQTQHSHNIANAWIQPCLKPETEDLTVPQTINPSFCLNLFEWVSVTFKQQI